MSHRVFWFGSFWFGAGKNSLWDVSLQESIFPHAGQLWLQGGLPHPAEDWSLFLQVLHETSLEGNVALILQRNENWVLASNSLYRKLSIY